MNDSTVNYLMHKLKEDRLFFQNNLVVEDLTKEIIEKTRKKVTKQYKIYRWMLAAMLSLIFATFLYLDIISPSITNSAQDIIRFWVIWLPLLSMNLYLLRRAWNGKRNLLIIELLEKEFLNNKLD